MRKTVLIFMVLSVNFSLFTSCGEKDHSDGAHVSGDPDIREMSKEEGNEEDGEDDGNMREIAPKEFVLDMGAGWNLGNAMDTYNSDETAWGNPLTTKAMIDEIAKMGFKTLRLPVTWKFHIGEGPDYLIEANWLDKVEAIANFALENEMYVIINIHHDETWILPTYEKADEVKDELSKVWTQIANRFKTYGDYLIFETLNEPRHKGTPEEWKGGTQEGRDVVNQYHQVSVDAIRATGGNNAKRKIMVSTYAASTASNALNDYLVPNGDKNVIVSVHSYFPYQFCLDGTDSTWGTEADKTALLAELDKIRDKFIVEDNRAVVMGEWGSTFSDNPEDRLAHAEFYARACAERGICPIWWDNGNVDEFGIFNRNTLEWNYPEIAEAIVKETTEARSKAKTE
ncbi:glycoside hydrolase family 5 protein [Zobellia galactanivorans]|uniref:glycoside hydrolase family 5 protein n=1 Tax=Zobellia galactanivorans (strain DSM 12802 / CCUG 47099 / CIP 106680 / NCIMB 13871 / Dsij) TaxID=63186 RepID=UPI0026E43914|nr:glycoside hydrolase family 5 protein [Zobellia galactanivorans]MDO6809935.1 glycoside hydrolase family 5 protein [Zobellia galactanivorans]